MKNPDQRRKSMSSWMNKFRNTVMMVTEMKKKVEG
jgi:hypothetical protein